MNIIFNITTEFLQVSYKLLSSLLTTKEKNMETKKDNSVAFAGKDKQEEEDKDVVVASKCPHCGNHPCVIREIEHLLVSILETYGEWKTKKQVCFKMYSHATMYIHGLELGRGIRKKLLSCVTNIIREMSPAPNDKYQGFVKSSNKT